MKRLDLTALLSSLILCACSHSPEIGTRVVAQNSEVVAENSEEITRAEHVAEQVKQKAQATEKKEGKQDLVKDEVRVKTEDGEPVIEQTGEASSYGRGFHGKITANGEKFNKNELTAAHPSLPLGSTATVTNLNNGKSVDVRINDRGPYVKGRDIDLSEKAGKELDMSKSGIAPVQIEAKLPPNDDAKSAEADAPPKTK
jgi:rare lipoprotein A (peptidoglycan hydrolase)